MDTASHVVEVQIPELLQLLISTTEDDAVIEALISVCSDRIKSRVEKVAEKHVSNQLKLPLQRHLKTLIKKFDQENQIKKE